MAGVDLEDLAERQQVLETSLTHLRNSIRIKQPVEKTDIEGIRRSNYKIPQYASA
jgi:hypothetical protein